MKTIPAVVIFGPGHQQTESSCLTPLPSLQSSTPDHVSDRIPLTHKATVQFLRVVNTGIGVCLKAVSSGVIPRILLNLLNGTDQKTLIIYPLRK